MDFKKITFALLITTLTTFSTSTIFAASLIGDTVDAGMYWASDDSRILGYGLDSPFVVSSGDSDIKQYSQNFALNVESTGFQIDYNYDHPQVHSAGWAGYFKISDLSFGKGIADVIVDTNAINWDISTMLLFDSTSVTLNWVGITYDKDTYFNVSLIETPVPATVFMFAPALLGFIGLRRKAKNVIA